MIPAGRFVHCFLPCCTLFADALHYFIEVNKLRQTDLLLVAKQPNVQTDDFYLFTRRLQQGCIRFEFVGPKHQGKQLKRGLDQGIPKVKPVMTVEILGENQDFLQQIVGALENWKIVINIHWILKL